MKIIRGTQDAKGVVYQKQPDGGTGRMRCMKCQGLMTKQRLADGTEVVKCGGCGANHKVVALDRPTPQRVGTTPKSPRR